MVNVSVGGYGYTNNTALSSGDLSARPGVSFTGSGTFPGKNGGTGTVRVDVKQFLFWSFGSVTVSDPNAALPTTTGYVLFGPSVSSYANGSGFTLTNGQFKSYNVSMSLTEATAT